MRMTPLRIFLAIAAASALACAHAGAAEVSARLTSGQTSVGIPVQLQIEVEGSTNAYLPQQIEVEGLQIQPTGQSTKVQVLNFRMTASVVYNYTILPETEGTFQIPAIEVNVEGKSKKTQPLELVVKAGSAPPIPAPRPGIAPPATGGRSVQTAPPAEEGKLAFAEMIIPKASVYVGEMTPIEIRFYFNQGYPFRIQERPTFNGEGFTVEKLSDPQRSEQLIGDTQYHVFTFQTAITAVKPGELEIPSVTLDAIVSLPSKSPPGFENLFSQFFGNSGMPGFSDDRQIAVTSDPRKLTVKPLPKAGKPESFAGAIGDFTMEAGAAPKKAAAGDPVTLTLTVSGRGNFGAMGAPALTGTDGWRAYPPTEKFEPADTVGYGGTKIFENMLVAQVARTETPGAEFSYFDPSTGKYVTLTTKPIAVEAAAAHSAPQVAAAPSGPKPEADAAPTPESAPDARSGMLARSVPRSFRPLVSNGKFLVANGAAALALLAFLSFQVYRRIRAGEGARQAALRKHESRLLRELENPNLDDSAFFARAEEFLDCQAKRTGAENGRAHVPDAVARNPDAAAGLQLLIARADEAKFSSGAPARLDAQERAAIANALREVSR